MLLHNLGQMFNELCRKGNVSILSSLTGQEVSIRIKNQVDQFKTELYETKLCSVNDAEGLQKSFDNLEDLNEFLKDPNHFQLNFTNLTLTIVTKTEINKKIKAYQMGKMCLEHIQTIETKTNRVLVEQILTKCRKNQDLIEKDYKWIIKNMAMVLQNLVDQSQNLNYFKNQYQQQMKALQSDAIKSMNKNKKSRYQTNIYATLGEDPIQSPSGNINEWNEITKNLEEKKLNKEDFQSFKQMMIAELTNKFNGYDMFLNSIQNYLQISKQEQLTPINTRFNELEVKIMCNFEQFSEAQNKKQQEFLTNIPQFLKTKNTQINNPSQKIMDWIDWQCNHSNKLSVENRKIISHEWSNIVGKPRLSKLFAYSVFIQKMSGFISIGIIDSGYKNRQSMGENQIVYYNDGVCYVMGKKNQQKNKLNEGQTIRVILDTSMGTIQWMEGVKQIHKLQQDSIKDPTIIWVPYIYISNKDDIMEIIQ